MGPGSGRSCRRVHYTILGISHGQETATPREVQESVQQHGTDLGVIFPFAENVSLFWFEKENYGGDRSRAGWASCVKPGVKSGLGHDVVLCTCHHLGRGLNGIN